MELDKIYTGDAHSVLREQPSDSIDLIVTDPPYQLSSIARRFSTETDQGKRWDGKPPDPYYRVSKGFIGKEWDVIPDVETWKECLRVLKPGAFAFVMCTPRQDSLCLMISRLMEAGFDMGFTSLYWTYACVSEDTEILTENGWENWNGIQHLNPELKVEVLTYDKDDGSYRWEIPSRWNHFTVKDTCYRIKSDYTDQLISRGHRCLVEQEGILLFQTPEEIEAKGMEAIIVPYLENVPELPDNISISTYMAKKGGKLRTILRNKLQAEGKYTQISSGKWKIQTFDVRGAKTETIGSHERCKEPSMEGWGDISEPQGQLCQSINKICEMPKGIFGDGKERWLCDGASVTCSAENRQTTCENRGSTPYKSQRGGQSNRESNTLQKQPGPQTIRSGAEYKTTLATITREYYDGIVYCPTVSTGCFVARRNGKIFLTGNSGFPKGANLSKQVDKRLGIKRKVVGSTKGRTSIEPFGAFSVGVDDAITIPSSDQAKALNGSYSGYQPKPAVEVILVCMKSLSEKTFIDQALKNGKGITWLSDCKIPCGQITTGAGSGQLGVTYNWSNTERAGGKWENKDGRFPANLLISDDVLNDGEIRRGQQGIKTGNEPSGATRKEIYGDYRGYSKAATPRDDPGSFSRYFDLDSWFSEQIKKLPKSVQQTFPYFLVAKTTRAERNMGCEKLSEGKTGKQKNTHPTVKPIKLLSYLIILGSREGDVVLDPFIGSGTTALACLMLSRHYVGIDIEEEYVQIAQARIEAYNKQLRLF